MLCLLLENNRSLKSLQRVRMVGNVHAISLISWGYPADICWSHLLLPSIALQTASVDSGNSTKKRGPKLRPIFDHCLYTNIETPILIKYLNYLMNNSYKKFANLRVYKNVSTPRICNILLCNRLMKIPIMVENASRLYKVSSLMFTPYLTDSLMNKTFCRVFTGGNTLD